MAPKSAPVSANFGFLTPYGARVQGAAAGAERTALTEPLAALFYLRQFGEFLAQEAAAHLNIYNDGRDTQAALLQRLSDKGFLTRDVAALFHTLRSQGNAAIHDATGDGRSAVRNLRLARRLAIWFHRALSGDTAFNPGKFVAIVAPAPSNTPPAVDAIGLDALRAAHESTKAQNRALANAARAAEKARLAAETAKAESESAKADAEADGAAALDLAEELEAQYAKAQAKLAAMKARYATASAENAEWQERLDALRAEAAAASKRGDSATDAIIERAKVAGRAQGLGLTEAETRALIDQQLRDAGWEADSETLRHSAKVRPIKGHNLAIAEWPAGPNGRADYVLFMGLRAVGVVEAKRKRVNVASAIEQAKRYSREIVRQGDEVLNRPDGTPWGAYKIPFLFATNGRPFQRQFKDASGICFLDARRPTNHPAPTSGWYTPEGLKARLKQDHDQAEAALRTEPTDYLSLRDYQRAAIHAVETAIIAGQRNILLAMATGTGKTRTALGLIYRLIKAKRFHRVLFLVDRTSLGEQALETFENVPLESRQSMAKVYDVMGLSEAVPEDDTRLHVATIQGTMQRVLFNDGDGLPVPVDRYDCIIVDESHRGYTLDREMSEGEVIYRDEADYRSKYRRVLDHFDAVRIGLTATPALHTSEIFGAPVYKYGYRQAVLDGFLVDHEPPISLTTQLGKDGIHWAVGENVATYNPRTGQGDLFKTPDEIDIEITGFNTQVVTEGFNKTICAYLAQHIDPDEPGKTLIFCATDYHADTVVRLLKAAYTAEGIALDDNAVMKITGATDKPLQAIRLFKNEAFPNIAVTVDLLSTGIDVPKICNIVFLRRVRSRILYEQMLGRATRLCPEIGKEVFRIYDAVRLYSALENHTDMKPVVTRTSLSFNQLAHELAVIGGPVGNDGSDEGSDEGSADAHCQAVTDQFRAKFHRKKGRLEGDALSEFEDLTGLTPEAFSDLLKRNERDAIRDFFIAHPRVGEYLDALPPRVGRGMLHYDGDDTLIAVEHGYGDGAKPADYLEQFTAYLQEHGNDLPALLVVTQRPRDMTRADLKALRLALDTAGFPLRHLQSAWRETTNQDIAAGIMGFIRRQTLGAPLLPYDQRVDRALNVVLAKQAWTMGQKRWLKRIAKQLKQNTIVDRAALDRGAFQSEGGFNRINTQFDGKLEAVIGDLHEELWRDAG